MGFSDGVSAMDAGGNGGVGVEVGPSNTGANTSGGGGGGAVGALTGGAGGSMAAVASVVSAMASTQFIPVTSPLAGRPVNGPNIAVPVGGVVDVWTMPNNTQRVQIAVGSPSMAINGPYGIIAPTSPAMRLVVRNLNEVWINPLANNEGVVLQVRSN